MENNEIIEVRDAEITEEVKKESKVKGFVGKVGSGIKRNWKTIAVGAGALMVGVMLGSRKNHDEEDYEETYEESESETEESEE